MRVTPPVSRPAVVGYREFVQPCPRRRRWCDAVTGGDAGNRGGIRSGGKRGQQFGKHDIAEYRDNAGITAVSTASPVPEPDLAQSGFPGATAWQWIQGFRSITVRMPDVSTPNWDPNVSAVPDPSHPDRELDAERRSWVTP